MRCDPRSDQIETKSAMGDVFEHELLCLQRLYFKVGAVHSKKGICGRKAYPLVPIDKGVVVRWDSMRAAASSVKSA